LVIATPTGEQWVVLVWTI